MCVLARFDLVSLGGWMERFAIFGKGGGGKSTIATNLSYLYAKAGLRVLHVGCDPKRDSTLRLLGTRAKSSMIDFVFGPAQAKDGIERSRHGIDCVEAGGPEPGVGCAGRGIILTVEQFERMKLVSPDRYDVVMFDVLGDLVCGGFAAPLRAGFAQKVVVVCSDEPMSLFAANNIARMVRTYASSGAYLAGLVGNSRGSGDEAKAVVDSFAQALGTTVLAHFGREPLVRRAERQNLTVAEYAPDAPISAEYAALAKRLHELDCGTLTPPTPMDDLQLEEFLRQLPLD